MSFNRKFCNYGYNADMLIEQVFINYLEGIRIEGFSLVGITLFTYNNHKKNIYHKHVHNFHLLLDAWL